MRYISVSGQHLLWRYPGSQWWGSCALTTQKYDINPAPVKCSICSFQTGCWYAPRRSSSRSVSGLMYDSEFWMSSTVRRIVAGGFGRRRNGQVEWCGLSRRHRRKVREDQIARQAEWASNRVIGSWSRPVSIWYRSPFCQGGEYTYT